jgi:DNA-3-methyladenine glycosylase
MGMSTDRARLEQPALLVAPALLGALLVSTVDDLEVVARITEVEAYEGAEDPASHAYRGRTSRNGVMFGEAGHLYCYFVYGMHWCANVICGPDGIAAGILLRGAQLVSGEAIARSRTGAAAARPALLARGPARLAKCLGLSGQHTGMDLLAESSVVRLEVRPPLQPYLTGPRVGVASAADRPWRFWLPDEPSVSTYRPAVRRDRA